MIGDKFMPGLHLRKTTARAGRLRYTYSACVPFTKHRDRIEKLKEIGELKCLYIYIYIYI